MRTTLDIEPDILQAAKEIAAKDRTTAGKVLSQLARQGLSLPPSGKIKVRNGVPQLTRRGEIITSEHVRRILDEEGG